MSGSMIKSLTTLVIRNFQNHKKTVLKFAPGLNVIVGRTDAGKSGILRALRWLCFNRPSGKAFRSHWGGKTSVFLKTMEGVTVKRMRWPGNKYFLNGKELKAFGQSVPDEIVKKLNITELNWQEQTDPHFLLSSSAAEVGRTLNEVASLEDIDKTQSNLRKLESRTLTDLKVAQTTLEEVEEELKEFEYVDAMEEDISALEQLVEEVSILETRLSSVTVLCKRIQQTKKELGRLDYLLGADDDIKKLRSLQMEYEELDHKMVTIANTIGEITLTKKELAGLESEVGKLEKKLPEVCPTCGKEI